MDEFINRIIAAMYYEEEIPEKQRIDFVNKFGATETVDLKYEFNQFFACNTLDHRGFILI